VTRNAGSWGPCLAPRTALYDTQRGNVASYLDIWIGLLPVRNGELDARDALHFGQSRNHSPVRAIDEVGSDKATDPTHTTDGKQPGPIVAEPIIELGTKIAPLAVPPANGSVSVLGTRQLQVLPP
jgi:hypothetical protein